MSLWHFQSAVAGWLKAHAAPEKGPPSDEEFKARLLEDARAEVARKGD